MYDYMRKTTEGRILAGALIIINRHLARTSSNLITFLQAKRYKCYINFTAKTHQTNHITFSVPLDI